MRRKRSRTKIRAKKAKKIVTQLQERQILRKQCLKKIPQLPITFLMVLLLYQLGPIKRTGKQSHLSMRSVRKRKRAFRSSSGERFVEKSFLSMKYGTALSKICLRNLSGLLKSTGKKLTQEFVHFHTILLVPWRLHGIICRKYLGRRLAITL